MHHPWLRYMCAQFASIIPQYNVSNDKALRWLVDMYIYVYTCWFLHACICMYICVPMGDVCMQTNILVNHSSLLYISQSCLHSLSVELFAYLFVQGLCPFSYFILLLSSFYLWFDGLYKNFIYDNVRLSFARNCITVIRGTFPCIKILKRRRQILTVLIITGMYHRIPCCNSEI